jgi:hypothetical protein
MKDKSIRNEVKRGIGSFLKEGEQKIEIEIFNKAAKWEVSSEK